MTQFSSLVLPAVLLTLSRCILARQAPYNPTTLIRDGDGGVYILNPNSSPQFVAHNATLHINSSDTGQILADTLPFLNNGSRPFTTSTGPNGILVAAGDCSDVAQNVAVWEYSFRNKSTSWVRQRVSWSGDNLSLGTRFLSSAITFEVTNITSESTYMFGGTCPITDGNITSWTANASYSNAIISVSQQEPSGVYQFGQVGEIAPPISEAGQTWTPLLPASAEMSSSNHSLLQQQNFVLIGGHTRTAFINMSQVALFSLPEQSWAYLGIDQPNLVNVEPRSGHTAVLTEDGSQIVILGGWVGDVSNPATPQMAILNVGQGYGGTGSWSWTVPSQANSPYTDVQGIFGHGALLLPNDVMMVAGGFPITKPGLSKRDSTSIQFYNVRTNEWSTTYDPPARSASPPAKLSSSAKVGIGAGVAIGLVAILVILLGWIMYARYKKQRRSERERELRAMALGVKSYSNMNLASTRYPDAVRYPEMRSASWGSRQERIIGNDAYEHPPDPPVQHSTSITGPSAYGNGWHQDTNNVPNPSRNWRQGLRARDAAGYSPNAVAPGSVFTIDEVEEDRSQSGSVRNQNVMGTKRPSMNPFGDAYEIKPQDEAALQRRKEVEGWVEDWASAAESMSVSRTPSKATGRTYSNLSVQQASSEDRASPVKSDRTGSNLSDHSNRSGLSQGPPTSGGLARAISQRSSSAGYALFAGAASAMSRMAGLSHTANADDLKRNASKRSISTGDLSKLAARKRSNSIEQKNSMHPPPIPVVHQKSTYDQAPADFYYTPPESPIKDYKNASRTRSSSLTSQSKKAINVLTSATKRVLTGTGHVDVQSRVETFEGSGRSPTKPFPPERLMTTDALPSTGRSTSASTRFWKQQQGPHDWQDTNNETQRFEAAVGGSTRRRRSGRTPFDKNNDDASLSDEADWDVETAVQQRVVQVMFSVPKEKLRVVNADNISLISRSETNASRDDAKVTPPSSPPAMKAGSGSRIPSAGNRSGGLWSSGAWQDDAVDTGALTVPQDKGKGKAVSFRSQLSEETIGKAV